MKILFISHDASRSGGPILLRNFIRWISKNTNHEFQLLYRVGGLLEPDFQKLTITELFYPKYYNNYNTVMQKVLNRLGFYKFKLKRHHQNIVKKYRIEKFDVIYSNTVVNLDVLEVLKELKIPIITHVRELESTIEHFGGDRLIKGLNELNKYFIADSYAVKENLISKHAIKENKIEVVHEYVELPNELPNNLVSSCLRKELGIPENAFIVGASGGGLWRKGYDLFIQTAIASCKKVGNENVYFIWVGGFKSEIQSDIDFDLDKSGLKDKILFVGAQKKPLDYFSLFDVFVLASREEPFGIVGMESALFETPVLCFENSGGMPEFITEECGIAVPYLDIPKLVDAIQFFKDNEERRKQYGLNARNKVLGSHTLEIKSRELLKIMEEQL
jgi:glycosyltransferase involved in cell wall biosynthesis